jgi:hypothetical protein
MLGRSQSLLLGTGFFDHPPQTPTIDHICKKRRTLAQHNTTLYKMGKTAVKSLPLRDE